MTTTPYGTIELGLTLFVQFWFLFLHTLFGLTLLKSNDTKALLSLTK